MRHRLYPCGERSCCWWKIKISNFLPVLFVVSFEASRNKNSNCYHFFLFPSYHLNSKSKSFFFFFLNILSIVLISCHKVVRGPHLFVLFSNFYSKLDIRCFFSLLQTLDKYSIIIRAVLAWRHCKSVISHLQYSC